MYMSLINSICLAWRGPRHQEGAVNDEDEMMDGPAAGEMLAEDAERSKCTAVLWQMIKATEN